MSVSAIRSSLSTNLPAIFAATHASRVYPTCASMLAELGQARVRWDAALLAARFVADLGRTPRYGLRSAPAGSAKIASVAATG